MNSIDPTELRFRYRFSNKSFTNVPLPEGLYSFDVKGEKLVLQVDKFGELRISEDTPFNNINKLKKLLKKSLR